MSVPPPLLLLGAVLALVAVIALWKLLVTAGLIGLAQWAVVTQTEDPAVVLVVIGVPALVLAVLIRRTVSRAGRRAGLLSARSARRLEVTR
jgi:hypothetical protein